VSTPSLAQRRAAHALKRIEGRKSQSYGNYVSYANALPATILMNGLGQACATLLSKAEGHLDRPHGMLYADLQSWLCGTDPAAPFKGEQNLMTAITSKGQDTYLRSQAEALEYLVWLKKFANAYLNHGNPV
jgi:CRISPR-associated protein Cmr5